MCACDFCISLICRDNRRPHHDLSIASGCGDNRTTTGLKPAVQSTFFAWRRASTGATSLQSSVSYSLVVASK